jgi:RND family efflux transporter MFP subunit
MRSRAFRVGVGVSIAVVVAVIAAIFVRTDSKTNKIALASKPVSYALARAAEYRASRTYVGTIRPWIEASVGPQFVAAYVDTVLVRPGARVDRNEVLATLDCRNASAASLAIAGQARAIDARQKALADEAARKRALLDGGFIAENEVVQTVARSEAEAAQLAAQRASLTQSALQVDDCVLRSPFVGEVGTRFMDPGAFVRPGSPLVTIVDRSIVRVTIDVPETDFDHLAPGTPAKIHIVSTGRDLVATVSRRAPSADPGTRTVHVELDVADPNRAIPVNTTAEVRIDVGAPIPATSTPSSASIVQNGKAVLFTIDGDVAHIHALPLLGEVGSELFVAPAELAPNTKVVTEGRGSLDDGDHVAAKLGTESR